MQKPLVFWTGSISRRQIQMPEAAYAILTKELSLDLRALRLNRSRRAASVEIEVAALTKRFGKPIAALRETLDTWYSNVVHDGSLPPGGFEINAAPACGDALIAELTEIGDALAAVGASVNERCGLHVHIDTRDFMYQDIQRLAKLYAATEWALFASCTEWRVDPENHYCTPCGAAFGDNFMTEKKETKEALIQSIYGKRVTTAKSTGAVIQGRVQYYPPEMIRYAQNRRGNINENRNRYWALNLHSWFMRGTVECRMRQGSVDAKEMIMWARLWESLVDFAFAVPHSELEAMLSNTLPYNMGFASSSHLAALIAGMQVKPGSSNAVRRATGSKLIFTGVGIMEQVLPKDVFQWFLTEINKRNAEANR